MGAASQEAPTKTGRLQEDTLLDGFCLQLCPAFESPSIQMFLTMILEHVWATAGCVSACNKVAT